MNSKTSFSFFVCCLDYVKDADKVFVANTIKAIGLCASNVPSVAEKCMRTLLVSSSSAVIFLFFSFHSSLLPAFRPVQDLVTSPSEVVVAQSIVVLRQMLQQNADVSTGVVISMVRLIDKVKVASARCAIVWVMGEYRYALRLYLHFPRSLLCAKNKKKFSCRLILLLCVACLPDMSFPSWPRTRCASC